jgi:hypothetical protein
MSSLPPTTTTTSTIPTPGQANGINITIVNPNTTVGSDGKASTSIPPQDSFAPTSGQPSTDTPPPTYTNPQEHLMVDYQQVMDKYKQAQQARQAYLEAANQYEQLGGQLNDRAYSQFEASQPPGQLPLAGTTGYGPSLLPQGQGGGAPTTPPTGDPNAMMASLMQDPQAMAQLQQLASQMTPEQIQAMASDPAVQQQLAALGMSPEMVKGLLANAPQASPAGVAQGGGQPPAPAQPAPPNPALTPQDLQAAQALAAQLSPQDVDALMKDPQIQQQLAQLQQSGALGQALPPAKG